MANWISHLIIVDRLLDMGLDLDERGFAVGNIAPDCNAENEDWSQFTPPREVTHWMRGESKLTADFEAFYHKYLCDREFGSAEHRAFLWGYYAHLITDVEMQRFIRDGQRVRNIFDRVKQHPDMRDHIAGMPENFDTIKSTFGKRTVANDIVAQEIEYLRHNPQSRYLTIIKRIHDFPDYLDDFPKDAVPRKIRKMTNDDMSICAPNEFIFCTKLEFSGFLQETTDIIYNRIMEKL